MLRKIMEELKLFAFHFLKIALATRQDKMT